MIERRLDIFVLCEQVQFLQHTGIRVAISRVRRERCGDNSHGVHTLAMVPCIVEGPTGCFSELPSSYTTVMYANNMALYLLPFIHRMTKKLLTSTGFLC